MEYYVCTSYRRTVDLNCLKKWFENDGPYPSYREALEAYNLREWPDDSDMCIVAVDSNGEAYTCGGPVNRPFPGRYIGNIND